jgi:K+-transporting ATPase ATPase A chain
MITFGHLVQGHRAGWVFLIVMVALFMAGLIVCDSAETAPPPQLAGLHITGGNMEGKEVRFGVGESVLTAIVTSNAATGSYNSMHDSYQPQGVLAPLIFLLLGEVVFGGLGTGVVSIIMPAPVGVFLGGLMTGRTPEYLGKKITSSETAGLHFISC